MLLFYFSGLSRNRTNIINAIKYCDELSLAVEHNVNLGNANCQPSVLLKCRSAPRIFIGIDHNALPKSKEGMKYIIPSCGKSTVFDTIKSHLRSCHEAA